MSYMIEGGGSTTFSKSKAWLYRHPEASHKLLDMIANTCADFLVEQVQAGAQVKSTGHKYDWRVSGGPPASHH